MNCSILVLMHNCFKLQFLLHASTLWPILTIPTTAAIQKLCNLFNQSYEVQYITSLDINGLIGEHARAHTHTHTHMHAHAHMQHTCIRTSQIKAILRNQACTSQLLLSYITVAMHHLHIIPSIKPSTTHFGYTIMQLRQHSH